MSGNKAEGRSVVEIMKTKQQSSSTQAFHTPIRRRGTNWGILFHY